MRCVDVDALTIHAACGVRPHRASAAARRVSRAAAAAASRPLAPASALQPRRSRVVVAADDSASQPRRSRITAAAVDGRLSATAPLAASEPEPEAAAAPSRAICFRCGRALCLCAHLPDDGGADTRTAFVVVQSRHERFNALSTGRLAQLGLRNCTLLWDIDNDEVLPRPDLPPGTGVLFPGGGATMLAPGSSAPPALVVLDGTWAQAGRMLRKNAWLADLPRYEFPTKAEQRSTYRIRRQPKAQFLSTVECIARVLQAVEPTPGAGDAAAERLLKAFDALVESQLACLAVRTRGHRFNARRRRTKPADALSRRGITAGAPPPVVAYGEYLDGELLQWAAVRPASGEVFHAFVLCAAARAARGGADGALGPLGAPPGGAAAAAVTPAAFDAAWRAWLRPGERPVVWNLRADTARHPLGAAVREVPGLEALHVDTAADAPQLPVMAEQHALSLKEAYAALLAARVGGAKSPGPGTLCEAVAAEEGAEAAAAAAAAALQGRVTGRAAERLAHTVGMAAALTAAADELQRASEAAADA